MSTPAPAPVSLWSLTGDAETLAQMLADIDADATEENMAAIDDFFADLIAKLEAKTGATVHVIRHLEAMADTRKAHAKAVSELARANTSAAKRLRDRLRDALEAAGHTRVDGEWGRVTLRKAGGIPPLRVDEGAIPERFFRERVVVEVDKDAIRAALAAGEDVPGAALALDRPSSLVIKA